MNEVGRPGWWQEAPEKLTKLEEAFLKDLTDEQACVFAEITPKQLYYYQEINPEFISKKKLLKENVKARAKLNIAEDIIDKRSIETSKWYAERKIKSEFSPKQELEHSGNMDFNIKIIDDDYKPVETPQDAEGDNQEQVQI